MEYQAKLNDSMSLEVTQSDNFIGRLTYESWFKFNSSLVLSGGSTYRIEPRGFWGTTIELKDNEKVLAIFTMHWNGEIVIQADLTNTQSGYVLKPKGLFNQTFLLADHNKTVLLTMKPHLKWNKLRCEYQIESSKDFESSADKSLLLLLSIHCANYYMSMASGTM
jgi:hypothetical protein